MVCLNCQVGYHWQCSNISEGSCCDHLNVPAGIAADVDFDDAVYESDDKPKRAVGGQMKSGDAIKDKTSTGRKRAAMIWPREVMDTMSCQWAGLKFAGGGVHPIIGCNPTNPGKCQDRHHGPDKSVLNNSPANLHAICKTCHNRWHTLNDPYYDGERPGVNAWTPAKDYREHDPDTKATPEEVIKNELMWKAGGVLKALDPDMSRGILDT